ncbi:MAG: efflux RND transporter periplasmic adaptor subunit [Phycisphaerales bacterium]|nr:MAG: efflux RND transporter periplasmic adaptor subunit [Phycisphaerales bacterium]
MQLPPGDYGVFRRCRFRWFLFLAAIIHCWPGAMASGQEGVPPGLGTESHAGVVVGFTAPFRKATLATLQQGRIRRFAVDEGQMVARGDTLVELDDAVQRALTEIARLEAESDLRVELARVEMKRAQEELDRVSRLSSDAMASAKEMSEARAEADAARLSFGLSKLEHEEAVQDYKMHREILAQLAVHAPFAGYVSAHLKELGETVEEREGIIDLVQLDPLLISVDCPLELMRSVQLDKKVEIRPVDSAWRPRVGTVTFINRVADAASQTFKVKLHVPNKDLRWISGLKVEVHLGRDPVIDSDQKPPDDGLSVDPPQAALMSSRRDFSD